MTSTLIPGLSGSLVELWRWTWIHIGCPPEIVLMQRRDFIGLLGGAAATWPSLARAQQGERVRRIAVLISLAENDRQGRDRLAAFVERLRQLGWTSGRNAQFEIRWAAANADLMRQHVAELVALAPDVIFASGGSTMAPLLRATRTIPIVFSQVPDPVGAGFVESLARPGGNATGFAASDFALSAKLLELLKQIAPNVTRVAVLRDASISSGIGSFAVMQSFAPSLGVELNPVGMRDAGEIERSITAFARGTNGGLILTASGLAFVHRNLIVGLVARHRLPAVYFNRVFVDAGGLISYGNDAIDTTRRAASYVDRILKGEKPANLPVQAPTKLELVVNLKTAKTIGLILPDSVLARADQVIE